MKTWLIGMTAVLGLMLVVPDQVEAQGDECIECAERAFYEYGEPVVKHRFDSSGGEPRWCEGVGKDPNEEQRAAGPAKEGGCDSCHNDWVVGMCFVHDSCAEPGPVAAQVDQVVSALRSFGGEASVQAASELAVHVATISNLTVDRTRGTLKLTDCQGRLFTEWSVPEPLLNRLAGLY